MTPNGPGEGRPDVADVLRSALEREASTIEVAPDALGDIRRRIADRRAKWLPRPLRTPGGVMFTTLGTAAFRSKGFQWHSPSSLKRPARRCSSSASSPLPGRVRSG